MKHATSLALLALSASVIAQGPMQTALPGNAIPQFVDRLPTLAGLDPAGTMTTVVAPTALELHMREFRANVLPATFTPPDGWLGGLPGTVVWGYVTGPAIPAANSDSYIGPVVVAMRGTPTEVRYVNDLGTTASSNLTFWKFATDRTLHWADPLGQGHGMGNYVGPIPAVAHLHGGEVPPQLDGGPDSWFTSDGARHGLAYYTRNATDVANSAVYRYPNSQEAANIWFHDHTLGATRLNVYAGLAGAWVVTEPAAPANLPSPLIPLVIQDRSFDTHGQLYFPSVGINPEHPFWIPEFVGDAIVVNGKTWPFFNVEPKAYRFLFLNGSNARTYDMYLTTTGRRAGTPTMWILGTDGGYLDTAVQVGAGRNPPPFVMMPGERYEVIVDFSGMRPGSTVTLNNRANMPFPLGLPVDPATTANIMKFNVVARTGAGDGYNPGTYRPGQRLRGSRAAGTQAAIVRLPGTTNGPRARVGVNVQRVRQMTLNEVMGSGGPLEVLVNNTKWAGHSVATDVFAGGMRPDFPMMLHGSHVSEVPNEGDVEQWEIVNMTADAHPIHLHLVQFQLIERQTFDLVAYQAAYDALFPGSNVAIDPMMGMPYAPGMFMGGFGPPLPYDAMSPLSAGKLGGNPDVYATARRGRPVFMTGNPTAPLPWEQGWKDTVVMYPGQVTRIAVRWAPTAAPLGVVADFPFDPNGGDGYVWHCHIVDHEDNEMMRPTVVIPDPMAIRSYLLGVDF